MTGKLSIRKATNSDLGNLLSLYRELNPDDIPAYEEDAGDLLKRVDDISGSCVLVGYLEAQIVTSCTLLVLPNLTRKGRPYGLVENVITASQFRRLGFGKEVILEAVQIAWVHDCYKLMLLTGSSDPGTISFYEQCGFSQSKLGFQIRNSAVQPLT